MSILITLPIAITFIFCNFLFVIKLFVGIVAVWVFLGLAVEKFIEIENGLKFLKRNMEKNVNKIMRLQFKSFLLESYSTYSLNIITQDLSKLRSGLRHSKLFTMTPQKKASKYFNPQKLLNFPMHTYVLYIYKFMFISHL